MTNKSIPTDSQSDDLSPLKSNRPQNTCIKTLWRRFNVTANELSTALGRTNNIVGEYAEYLANEHYLGRLLQISGSSADIETSEGTRYQVKSRKIISSSSTQLNVIRSWDFDFLIVILFKENGDVFKAIEVPVEVAKDYAKRNEHQRGWVITTSQKFLSDDRNKEITDSISRLNSPDA